jgi:CHASE3 domain sensor protein
VNLKKLVLLFLLLFFLFFIIIVVFFLKKKMRDLITSINSVERVVEHNDELCCEYENLRLYRKKIRET